MAGGARWGAHAFRKDRQPKADTRRSTRLKGVKMWRWLLDRFVRQIIETGSLKVTYPDGSVGQYGDGTGTTVHVTLHETAIIPKLLRDPDLGVGEAYTDGTLTIENDDLRGFMTIALTNGKSRNGYWTQRILNAARKTFRWLQQNNVMGRSKDNVAHHYDLSGELYDLFLDADKQYSCGYFPRRGMSLDEAQEAKKHHIARKLLIEPGMRVLDIGCGWGGMGLTLARDYGAEVVGVTLSEEQIKVAKERARAEGLEDKVDFRLQDYREVEGTFDRIVSVGMFEHVGVPYYREYFSHIHDKLTEDGVALIHTIGRAEPPGTTSSWIAKYIFPGGYVPALSEMMARVEPEHLIATDIEVWRLHYAETLRQWEARFTANEDRARELYDERFCRMWRYYLIACEMSFRHTGQVVFQVQLTHRHDAVPLSRDYLYRDDVPAEQRHAAE